MPPVQRAAHSDVARIPAHKAYSSHENAHAAKGRRSNAVHFSKSSNPPPDEGSAWSRMYHAFMVERESCVGHYHRHSSVEPVFSMVKVKFEDRC